MTWCPRLPIVVSAFLLIAGPIATAAADDRSEATQAVWSRHVAAAMARDVDAVMEDFTEDSVIVTTRGVLVGKDAIRGFVEKFLADFSPEVTKTIVVNAETAHENFIVSNFTIGAWRRTVHDTAVIEDGKIAILATVDYPAE